MNKGIDDGLVDGLEDGAVLGEAEGMGTGGLHLQLLALSEA